MKKLGLLLIMLVSLLLVGCGDNTELATETTEQEKNNSVQQNITNESEFSMKEKCLKYQSDVDKEKEKNGWSYAKVFYSKMYNSCLVDTFEHDSQGQTFYIYDFLNGKTILNCTMYGGNTKDMLSYDSNKFNFSQQEGGVGICNLVYDWMFELLQNPESEDLSVFLNYTE